MKLFLLLAVYLLTEVVSWTDALNNYDGDLKFQMEFLEKIVMDQQKDIAQLKTLTQVSFP